MSATFSRDQVLNTIQRRETAGRVRVMDNASRQVELAFASEEPVERWWSTEILDCSPDAVDLRRLNDGAPLLFNHNSNFYLGVVVPGSARVDSDRVCRCLVEFVDDPAKEQFFKDVESGILSKVSVGYLIHELRLDIVTDTSETYRATKWEPLEVSIVTVPADPTVGVGRSLNTENPGQSVPINCDKFSRGEKKMQVELEQKNSNGTPVAATEPAKVSPEQEVVEFARMVGQESLASEYLLDADAPSKAGFRAFVKERKATTPAAPVSVVRSSEGPVVEPTYTRSRIFKDAKLAYQWSRFLCAIDGYAAAQRYCQENGIHLTRAQEEKTNSKGGYLVHPQFLPELINHQDEYGVAAMEARVIDMTSDTLEVDMLTSGFTFFADSELGTIKESELGFGQILFKPKKFSGFAKQSGELSEDAAIAFFDILTEEILRGAAYRWDDTFFNGDGGSSYNGILGLVARLRNPLNAASDPTVADVAGLQEGSGNLWSELTLDDFIKLKAKLRKRFRKGAKWYVSPEFKEAVMLKLALAANGALTTDVINGNEVMKFLNAPVVEVEVLPSTQANSQICAIYGNLPVGSWIGRRRELAIATSEHVAFLQDSLVTRATMRFDVNHFSVGNVDATPGNQVRGTSVALITAAS